MTVFATRKIVQKMYPDIGSRQHMAVMMGIGFRHYCRLENETTPVSIQNHVVLEAIRRLVELDDLRDYFDFCDKIRRIKQ